MNNRTIRYLTIFSDIILFNVGFALAYIIRYQWEWLRPVTFYQPYSAYLPQQLLLNLVLIFTFARTKVWRRKRGEFITNEIERVGYATAAGIILMWIITFFIQPEPYSRLMLIWAFAAIVLLVSLARILRRATLSMLYQNGKLTDKVLVIGSGETGRSLIRTLLARPDLGFKAIGYLHDGRSENNIGLGRIPNLGNFADLSEILQQHPRMHTVFIALPGYQHQEIARLLQTCHQFGIRAQVVPDLLQLSMNRVEFNNMAGIPTLGVRDVGITRNQQAVKRSMDLFIILLLSPLALILGALIALAIRLDSDGPILYSGIRIGKNQKPFKMYKFRSMIVDADAHKDELKQINEKDGPIFKIKEDPRMTRIGRWIRRASLDELPQLYNVLRGQMSLVGPRPPLPEEVAEYKPWHMQRLSVIGGITGLWQVSGRSDLTFDELCLLDIYYIENWSLAMDIRILLQTIPHMLFGRGAY